MTNGLFVYTAYQLVLTQNELITLPCIQTQDGICTIVIGCVCTCI